MYNQQLNTLAMNGLCVVLFDIRDLGVFGRRGL